MRDHILADRFTTGDVARALHLTREGARYLARTTALPCMRTPAKWRLFHREDVLRLAEKRTKLHLAGKLPRRGRLGPRGQPRQLSLLGPALRLVGGTDARKLDKGQVRGSKTLGKRPVSDSGDYENPAAAGGRR